MIHATSFADSIKRSQYAAVLDSTCTLWLRLVITRIVVEFSACPSSTRVKGRSSAPGESNVRRPELISGLTVHSHLIAYSISRSWAPGGAIANPIPLKVAYIRGYTFKFGNWA